MYASLRDPAVRAVYLAALRDHGMYRRAAAVAGVSVWQSHRLRLADADFAAACAGAIGTRPALQPVRLSARRIDRFLAALAATGNVGRSCTRAGISIDGAYYLRRKDPEFAARWADARNRAIDRVEDALFDAALNGFARTDADGRTVRTQQASAMFKLLARRERGGSAARLVELTPALIEAARAKFDRQLRLAAASGTVPDYVVALPPATVTAP